MDPMEAFGLVNLVTLPKATGVSNVPETAIDLADMYLSTEP